MYVKVVVVRVVEQVVIEVLRVVEKGEVVVAVEVVMVVEAGEWWVSKRGRRNVGGGCEG